MVEEASLKNQYGLSAPSGDSMICPYYFAPYPGNSHCI
jgi:hypothetical protein